MDLLLHIDMHFSARGIHRTLVLSEISYLSAENLASNRPPMGETDPWPRLFMALMGKNIQYFALFPPSDSLSPLDPNYSLT